jgi:hypothetical protein
MLTFHRPYKVVVIETGPPAGVISAFAAAAAAVVGLIVFVGWFAWMAFLLEGLAAAGLIAFIVVVNRRELRAVPRPAPPRLESRSHADALAPLRRRELPAATPASVVVWPSRRSSEHPERRS